MKRIIGVTGGIASGKSNVCRVIKNLGYEVIDSDLIAKELSEKGKVIYNSIINVFGEEYLDENKEIDRKKLGKLIFNNSAAKLLLDKATHPYIVEEIKNRLSVSKNQLIFVDIPLLYDCNLTYLCDKIICVYVDLETQIERLMARDKIEHEYALSKINSQMSLEKKKELADFVIDSSKSFENTEKQVLEIIEKLKEKCDGGSC